MELLAYLRDEGVRLNAAGKGDQATAMWIDMMKYQRSLAGPDDPVRYLRGESWTAGIGHIAHLSFFAKRRLLGLKPSKYVIATRPDLVANPYYLSLWRSYFEIIDIGQLPPDAELFQDYPMVLELHGQFVHMETAMGAVNSAWRAEKRGPLLAMPANDVERGREHMKKLGVDSWFVAMHVRQSGLGDQDHLSVRNVADVSTYQRAVDRINAAGGRVVRIGGDELARPLREIVDLPNAPDWLDVFLISQCRFFMGVNSGPSSVAETFGAPLLLTNYAPRGGWHPYEGDDILRKHLRDSAGRETPVRDPASNLWSKADLAKLGLTSSDNTAEEIDTAAAEMIRRTE